MKFTTYKLLTFIIAFSVLGSISWFLLHNSENEQKEQVSTNFNFESNEENEEQKRINAEERWKHEFEMIKNPETGRIPEGIREREVKAAYKAQNFKLSSREVNSEKVLPAIIITGRGPNNYGGRTRALGFDIRNTNIVLAGGVTSGIYRSTNNGASWTRVTPAGVIHSLSCLAQDPRVGHQDTWYAGTGEAVGSAGVSGASYFGHGVYKSTDNGLTWAPIATTQSGNLQTFDNIFDFVHRMVVNPDNGNLIASTSDVIAHLDVSTGVATTVVGTLGNSAMGDVIYNAAADKFYAAIHGQDDNGGIYESSNGTAWVQIRTPQQIHPTGDPDPAYNYDVKRIVLANVANTTGIVAFFELFGGYGFACGGTTTEAGLLHYDGANWTNHTGNIGNCSGSATSPKVLELQGGYNMALATKPNDANIVYLAGTEAYRYNLSTNAYEFIGGSQEEANNINLHVDQHIFMFEPGSNDIMWAGNDGGLRKTDVTSVIKTTAGDDNGYDWTARSNDYNGYQYYGVDIDPADGSNFIAGGAQDNAFTIQPVDATADEVGPTVDGVDVAIISGGADFTTHNLFMMWQNGSMVRFEDGNFATGDISPASTDFVGRFYLDADNTNYLYYPSSNGRLYRTRIAESISSSSTTGNSATGWENLTGVKNAISDNVSAIDASRDLQYGGDYSASDPDRKLYIGTEDGEVFRLDNPAFSSAGTTPVNITPAGASGFVSDIAVNPTDDKEILLTYSSYGVNSVYHTSDASIASPMWTNIEGPSNSAVELASARSAMIVVESGIPIYMVGTSTGLYATDVLSGATTSWSRLGTTTDIGLAVSVEMRLRTSDNKIVLGTHGNGAFMLEFPSVVPVELTSFNGKSTERGNLLNWSTSSEEQNKGFEVQKSTDGKSFEKIGFIAGNGTSLENHAYNFLDNNLKASKHYYRLKQMDFDGGFEYSKIIIIENEVDTKPLALFPNPAQSDLTIENGQGFAKIYNISGQLIRTIQINNNRQEINVADLKRGVYILNIEKSNGEIVNSRFVKE